MAFIEHMVIEVTKATAPDRPIRQVPFPVFTYDDAIERFGSDKPDLRFAMELYDLAPALRRRRRHPGLGLPGLRRDARGRRPREGRHRPGDGRRHPARDRRADRAREAVRGQGPRPPLRPGGRRAARPDREVPLAGDAGRRPRARRRRRGGPGPHRRRRLGHHQRRPRPPPGGAGRAPRPGGPRRARLLLGPPLPDVPVGRARSTAGTRRTTRSAAWSPRTRPC